MTNQQRETFECACGKRHDAALRGLSLECAAYEVNGDELCRLDVAEGLHKQIIAVALVADVIEHSARTMARVYVRTKQDGDTAGAIREWCIAAREFDWAAQIWDAIDMHERAAKCRAAADAVRAGEYQP